MKAGRTIGLHHLIEGPEDAPVLVLSNSLGTTLQMWRDQAPALSERFRLVRYDRAANRDPRRWEDPDRFDVTRKASGHLAFGQGIHGCVGKPVARIEGEAVLGALSRNVGSIELVGEPERHLNNTVRSFESLPVTFHAR